jgi:hypothetical protein
MESNLSQQLESLIRQIAKDEFLLLMNIPSGTGSISSQSNTQSIPLNNIIFHKIGWLKGGKSLHLLYALFISYGFITCSPTLFKAHFLGSEANTERIVWLTHLKFLVYIFDRLMAVKFIPENRNFHQLIAENFLDKKGKMLKRGSLRSSLNEVRSSKMDQTIEDLLTQLINPTTNYNQ